MYTNVYWPRRDLTGLRGFRKSETQISLLNHRDQLENSNFNCNKFRYDTFQKANNKDADQTARMRRLVWDFDFRKHRRQVFLRQGQYEHQHEKTWLWHANNKGAEELGLLHSLISAFVTDIHYLESWVSQACSMQNFNIPDCFCSWTVWFASYLFRKSRRQGFWCQCQYSLCPFNAFNADYRERSGSVVECLTRDRRAEGSSLTGVTALWSFSKTHLS